MGLASSLRSVAKKSLAKFGDDVTFRRITTGTYNATTGNIAETASDTTVSGLIEDVNVREVNELVQADDRKVTIAASALTNTPTTTDRVVIGGVSHQIIRIKTITDGGTTAITYEVFLRA
jgi:hypothetical protein|tara:strand:- start:247 stop:606 length:360 start_codon:yes stop_codon:yes gene_type:complete